jgi:hypothetical protein
MKSTHGRTVLTSLLASSLVALSLTVGVTTSATAAGEEDAIVACYPPTGAACKQPEQTKVDAPAPNKTASPLPKATPLPTQETNKNAVFENLKNSPSTTKPIKLSSTVTLGGSDKTVKASLNAETGKGNVAVGTTLNAPTQVKAGPYAPGSAGGYIQVFLSTSGNSNGSENLGRYIADKDGYILLPAVTLKKGGLATFILREECSTQTDQACYKYVRKERVKGKTVSVEVFDYNGFTRIWNNFPQGLSSTTKLIGRSILTLAERTKS